MSKDHPLRAYRQEHDLTLEAIAEELGIWPSTLSRIETWQNAPSMSLVKRLIKLSRGKLRADDFLENR